MASVQDDGYTFQTKSLTTLPVEMLTRVLENASLKDALSFGQTNRDAFNAVSRNPNFAKRACNAVNPDGTKKWTYETGNWVESSPAIGSDGTVYVGSDDFMLHAVNPDGTKKWTYQTGEDVDSSPAIGSDGTVYVGSDKFYMLKNYNIKPGACLVKKAGVFNSFEPPVSPGVGPGSVAKNAFSGQCASDFNKNFCTADNERLLRQTYCEKFKDFPPYSCSREKRRDVLEAISLASGFTQMIYSFALIVLSSYLWNRFYRRGTPEEDFEEEMNSPMFFSPPKKKSIEGEGDLKTEVYNMKQKMIIMEQRMQEILGQS